MPSQAFIGNQAARTLLSSIVAGQRAHAVLLGGPGAVGKRTLAQQTIAALVGRTIRSGDPDVLDVSSQEIGPGGIGRDVATQVVKHLSRRPVASPRSCVLLTDVDRLTSEAANTLLVTLEEPPAQALLLLTADNPAAVLPTITSRCLPVQLVLVSDHELRAGLTGNLRGDIDRAVALAAGRPGRAVAYLTDETYAKRVERLREDLQVWSQGGLPERLQLATSYGKDREATLAFLQELDVALPLTWRRGLLLARRRLARNVQPRAVLEAFAMLPA